MLPSCALLGVCWRGRWGRGVEVCVGGDPFNAPRTRGRRDYVLQGTFSIILMYHSIIMSVGVGGWMQGGGGILGYPF